MIIAKHCVYLSVLLTTKMNIVTKAVLVVLLLLISFMAAATPRTKTVSSESVLATWEKRTLNMQNDSAIVFYENILKLSLNGNAEAELISGIYTKLGSLYRINADFTKSLEYDLNALRIAEELKTDLLLGSAYNSVGIDYYRINDYVNAEKFFLLSIKYYLKSGDKRDLADSYYKLAMVLDDTMRQDDAKEYYNLALKVFSQDSDCMGEADVFNGLAALYYKSGMVDSTEFFALKAMEKYQECGSNETVAFMYMNLASLMNMQKKHDKALDYLFKGLHIADSIGALSQLRQGYKNLSQTYSYTGNFEEAYKAQLKYEVYKDSIFNIEKSKSFIELNTKYETEKKERQISEKQAEIDLQNVKLEKTNQQKNFLIIIAILGSGMLVVIIFRFNEKRKYAKILDKQNKELAEINSAKDKLFSIISHDLSSPLSSYTRLTEALQKSFDKLSPEQLKEYISELNTSSSGIQILLSNLLQWSLHQSGHFNPQTEKANVNTLISNSVNALKIVADEKNIEIVRFADNPECEIIADVKMIETVFRNLISNAIKFSPENSVIEINTEETKHHINVQFSDNGPGLTEDELEKLFKPGEDVSKIGKDRKNKGTGLGLILAAEFTARNNAEIFAEINDNGGLQFTVRFKKHTI